MDSNHYPQPDRLLVEAHGALVRDLQPCLLKLKLLSIRIAAFLRLPLDPAETLDFSFLSTQSKVLGSHIARGIASVGHAANIPSDLFTINYVICNNKSLR